VCVCLRVTDAPSLCTAFLAPPPPFSPSPGVIASPLTELDPSEMLDTMRKLLAAATPEPRRIAA
jgi:hypothetical protein